MRTSRLKCSVATVICGVMGGQLVVHGKKLREELGTLLVGSGEDLRSVGGAGRAGS